MTNREILESLPIGEVVPRQVLAAMKRKGLIYDYSWNYLESANFWYKEERDGRNVEDFIVITLFPNGNAPKGQDVHGNLSEDEIYKTYGSRWGKIEYLGYTFEMKYLDGCFNPFLIKTGPKKDGEKSVDRKICLFGAII